MAIATINPATGETIQTFSEIDVTALEAKLALAQETFESYRHISLAQRSKWLQAAAQLLEAHGQRYGELMTLEMGKPIKAAVSEIQKCAWVCRYYAEQGAEFLADQFVTTDASQSFIRYQPLGVILAVMPWNFPFWQVCRFAAPALMAGNVGLLKHASNVPQCALALEELFLAAGFPPGAFQTLLVGADRVAEIVADDRVKAATLTGSEPAGASLAAIAGQHLKKTVLELGGSDPFIVLASADLEAAVSTAVTARMLNTGQSCIAAKRFIVQATIADEFTEKLAKRFQALKVGDPMHPDTDLGPLATPSILKELDHQVQTCLAAGARARVGGHPLGIAELGDPLGRGNFYSATLLTDLPPGSPAYQEEFFGPVALLFPVADLDQAIHLANSTAFGLGASGWTTDTQEADRLINEIEAGSVFINGLVKSDPRLPFGGIKRSGYGRELGIQGIHEFVNIKTIWVK